VRQSVCSLGQISACDVSGCPRRDEVGGPE
jgi:hypothetical protein